MKKYLIRVNGVPYEVEVEELGSSVSNQSLPMQRSAQEVDTQKIVAEKINSNDSSISGAKINAPMPGTVLKVNVSSGEKVQKGQVLLILEAMKMENEITASCDGKIQALQVKKGAQVNAGDVLCTIG